MEALDPNIFFVAGRNLGARLLLNFSPKKYDFQNEWLSSLCVAYCGR